MSDIDDLLRRYKTFAPYPVFGTTEKKLFAALEANEWLLRWKADASVILRRMKIQEQRMIQFAEEFFATARERYQIKLNREAGMPWPWTEDPIYQTWRFCNVHREDDKTTVWFRENIRQHTKGFQNVAATIAFRWFNRIETGEVIKDLLLDNDPWGRWHTEEARKRLRDVRPVVTGAYIIKGMDGMSKLDGILHVIDIAMERLPEVFKSWEFVRTHRSPSLGLEEVWKDLREFYYLGDFLAYEVVSDLRWSYLVEAPDIMSWANPGPGCARGLGVVTENDKHRFQRGRSEHREIMLPLMQELLALSRDPNYWPAEWRQWEMREVEHWLCEFDKYQRVVSGDRMKRRYRA